MIRHASLRAFLALLGLIVVGCGRSTSTVEPMNPVMRSAAVTNGPGSVFANWVPGQAIVALQPSAIDDDFLVRHRLTEIERVVIEGVEYLLVQFQAPIKAEDLLDTLRKDSDVRTASLNYRAAAPEFAGQPMSFDDGGNRNTPGGYIGQDLLFRIRAEEAHHVAQGAGARVAILDTGLDFDHPELSRTLLVRGLNFTTVPHTQRPDETRDGLDNDGDRLLDEGYGHGTHVAGIVHLTAPEATLIAIKVLDDEGWGTAFGLAAGIVNAIQLGANVINLSLGLTESVPVVAHAVAYAGNQGIGVVASAGNAGSQVVQYPAGYPEAFSVAAVNSHDILAPFSNIGIKVAIAAPGVDVISLMAQGTPLGPYAAGDGTSMAAPFLSGAAALVISNQPGTDGRTATGRVVSAAVPIDDVNAPSVRGLIGRGRVDLRSALVTGGTVLGPGIPLTPRFPPTKLQGR